jgi:hypothetical protein
MADAAQLKNQCPSHYDWYQILLANMPIVSSTAIKAITRYPLVPRNEFGTDMIEFCLVTSGTDKSVWKLSREFGGYEDTFHVTVDTKTGVVLEVGYAPLNRSYVIDLYNNQFVQQVKFPIRGDLTVTREEVFWGPEVAKHFFTCYQRLIQQFPPPSDEALIVEDDAMAQVYINAMTANHIPTKIVSEQLTDSY